MYRGQPPAWASWWFRETTPRRRRRPSRLP